LKRRNGSSAIETVDISTRRREKLHIPANARAGEVYIADFILGMIVALFNIGGAYGFLDEDKV